MRILDLYIGRFTYHSASTAFITQAAFVSVSVIIKFSEQVKGN